METRSLQDINSSRDYIENTKNEELKAIYKELKQVEADRVKQIQEIENKIIDIQDNIDKMQKEQRDATDNLDDAKYTEISLKINANNQFLENLTNKKEKLENYGTLTDEEAKEYKDKMTSATAKASQVIAKEVIKSVDAILKASKRAENIFYSSNQLLNELGKQESPKDDKYDNNIYSGSALYGDIYCIVNLANLLTKYSYFEEVQELLKR